MSPRGSGTRPQDFAVSELLEWIHARELVLPEFQRDYDWTRDRVLALAATIFRGWPAGSLLLQEIEGKPFFRNRKFEDGPELDDEIANLVVLDGQQRLTALYHALYDVGPSVYAVQASKIGPDSSVDEVEEAMQAFDRDVWDLDHRDEPFDPKSGWIPLYALRSPSDYFAWRDQASVEAVDRDRSALVISDAYRFGLERFQTYRLPAVIVESGLEPAAIARIFERVNRQGLALKTFDLMVARTFETNWNLRDRWDDACSDHPVLDRFFSDDGMPVIRAIALTALANVREQAVLTLEPSLVRLEWDQAVDAMAQATSFLEETCGVTDPAWVPYGGILVTLGALAREHELSQATDTLTKWFLTRSLGLRFETAANTVTVDEYNHLREVLNGRRELEEVLISEDLVREATRRRQGAMWRGFMCCLSMAGAVDAGLQPSKDADAIAHVAVFERARAAAPQPVESPHLLVLNQLLVRPDERGINHKGLDELKTKLDALDPVSEARVIEAQLLPAIQPGMSDTAFIAGRAEQLDRWLRHNVGVGLVRTVDQD